MKNKEDIFLIGLIIVIIVLVVALFMTPVQIAEVSPEGDASASIDIGMPTRESIAVEPEPVAEPEPEPVAEPEPEPVAEPEPEPEEIIITFKDHHFSTTEVTIESGTIVTWISEESYNTYQIDIVSFGQHTYSPRLKPGESWSIELYGPSTYVYNAVGYEQNRKGRIRVKG